MQSAKEVDVDFTGTSTQTILFDDDFEAQKSNIQLTESYINKLGNGEISVQGTSYVWRGVEFTFIFENLLSDFSFNSRARVFSEIETFAKWVKKITENGDLKKWNVILAGNGKAGDSSKDDIWEIGLHSVGKVNRSKKVLKNSTEDTINIGVLRTPSDLLADVYASRLTDISRNLLNKTTRMEKINEIRIESGVDDNPQLLIYRINKDSEARDKSKKENTRKDLNAVSDLIGLCITLPGINRKRLARSLTIDIEQKDNVEEWGEE